MDLKEALLRNRPSPINPLFPLTETPIMLNPFLGSNLTAGERFEIWLSDCYFFRDGIRRALKSICGAFCSPTAARNFR
jgi:hypothetical protein